jgi:NAD(P)-dependent dehydrogenase (short-subunit alcohol dehydrogenase family)
VDSRIVLITGATDGLGRALANRLAAEGWTLLVHGRDSQRIADTEAELRERGGEVRSYRADLSSLEQVRELAAAVAEAEESLDVLVNNAGIGTSDPDERELSQDGVELRFAVNYLSGYLLTRRLLPLLRSSAPARIVNVSSAGQMPIDFDDVMLEHGYSGVRAYCQSKLAQILFTKTLASELEGTGVTATALHPATYMPTKIVANPISTLEEGVEATWRLVASPEVEGVSGAYFNGTREAAPDPQAGDPDARRRLEELSRELTGT